MCPSTVTASVTPRTDAHGHGYEVEDDYAAHLARRFTSLPGSGRSKELHSHFAAVHESLSSTKPARSAAQQLSQLPEVLRTH